MAKLGTIARRTFIVGSAAIAGGVVFGFYKFKKPYPNPLLLDLPDGASTLTPYVRIDATGITIITPRAEMGQGIQTTLAALVAEELDVAWEDIHVEHGPASSAYYNSAVLKDGAPFPATDHGRMAEAVRSFMGVPAKFLGMQITGGSSSIADAYEKMRMAGASARLALLDAAADQLGVKASTLRTEDGFVIAADGKRIAYAALASAAAKMSLHADPPLKPKSAWRYLGKAMPRVDMVAKSTGAAQFGVDVRHPGMVYATVRMNPALEAPLRSFDATAARAMRGVHAVIELPGGVAVVADNTWRAFQAAKAVKCTWGDATYPATTEAMMSAIAASFDKKYQDSHFRHDGNVEKELASGDVVEAEYRVPHLAHATMEPMNATAWLTDTRLDVWVGTQNPTQTQKDVAAIVKLPIERVFIHTQLMGGGFGRRGEDDFAQQATRVALAQKGKPVKLTWTREEDMTHDMYRPAAIARFRGQVAGGTVHALDARIAATSVAESSLGRFGINPPGPDRSIVDGVFDQPYGIAHYQVTGYRTPMMVPVGFWRSVGNSHNAFFIESFLDELAVKAGTDPLAMRLGLMTHEPSRKVLEAVAELSSWKKPLAAGRGRGVAFNMAFGVPVAEVAEITVTKAGVKVDDVFVVADVGTALDPRNLEAQLQSAVIYGLSAAMFGEITFANGAVEQANFDQYQPVRMPQAPRITVKVLENGEEIRGVGEPGTPPIAPAVANAIFNATGQRIRELPLRKHITFV